MKVLRIIPKVGRIQLMGNSLVCQFNSKHLRELFGCLSYEYTHHSDVNIIEHDMNIAATGRYARFYTALFASKVQAVPYQSLYGH